MSGKFHLTPNGPKVCNAHKRACRYGDDQHFSSMDEADKAYADQLAKDNGNELEGLKKDMLKQDGELSSVRVLDIPAYNLAKFEKLIDKANSRLEKNGISDRFSFSAKPYQDISKNKNTGQVYVKDRVRISMNRPSISYNGFTFLSRVQEVENGKFVSLNYPGVDLQGWRPTSMNCEHCGKKRNRDKVYLVEDSEGNRKVVGGSCVKLYTGLSPQGIQALEWEVDENEIREDDDLLYSDASMGKPVDYSNDALAVAYVIAKKRGYQNSYSDHSTKDVVNSVLHPSRREEDKKYSEKILNEVKNVNIDDVKKEIRAKLEGNNSDWAHNVRTLIDTKYVDSKSFGTLVSAVSVLNGEEKTQKPWAKGFLGNSGDKVENVKAKVVKTIHRTEIYGYQEVNAVIITLQTEDGHYVSWKTSSDNIPADGDNIVFKATVKGTSTYKDIDQTKIVRAKWEKDPNIDNSTN